MFANCAIALGGPIWLGGGKYWHSCSASWGAPSILSGGMGTLFSYIIYWSDCYTFFASHFFTSPYLAAFGMQS